MIYIFKPYFKTRDAFSMIFVIRKLHHSFSLSIEFINNYITCYSYSKNSSSKTYHFYSGISVNENKSQIEEAEMWIPEKKLLCIQVCENNLTDLYLDDNSYYNTLFLWYFVFLTSKNFLRWKKINETWPFSYFNLHNIYYTSSFGLMNIQTAGPMDLYMYESLDYWTFDLMKLRAIGQTPNGHMRNCKI